MLRHRRVCLSRNSDTGDCGRVLLRGLLRRLGEEFYLRQRRRLESERLEPRQRWVDHLVWRRLSWGAVSHQRERPSLQICAWLNYGKASRRERRGHAENAEENHVLCFRQRNYAVTLLTNISCAFPRRCRRDLGALGVLLSRSSAVKSPVKKNCRFFGALVI